MIPAAIGARAVYAYPFQDVKTRAQSYWRDVGTLDAYYEANLELVFVHPELNIYDETWPIWTYQAHLPPAKFVLDEDGRRGMAVNSMIAGGCIISGGIVRDCVIGRHVYVHAQAELDNCVVFDYCDIGRKARLRNCILEKNVRIPEGAVIGYDLDADRKAGYFVTDSGLVIVEGKRTAVELTKMTL